MTLNKQWFWTMVWASLPVVWVTLPFNWTGEKARNNSVQRRWTHSCKANGSSHASTYGMWKSCDHPCVSTAAKQSHGGQWSRFAVTVEVKEGGKANWRRRKTNSIVWALQGKNVKGGGFLCSKIRATLQLRTFFKLELDKTPFFLVLNLCFRLRPINPKFELIPFLNRH